MYSVSGIMGIMAILYSRDLFIECAGLAILAVMIIGVLMTDTGTNKVSLKGYRILKELPDAPRPKPTEAEEIKHKAQKLDEDE
jgi:hypothetical protein